MTMHEIIKAHPEWSSRTQVEAWLTMLSKEAGEYAESALAEFGATLNEDGEASVDHLPGAAVEAIKLAALA